MLGALGCNNARDATLLDSSVIAEIGDVRLTARELKARFAALPVHLREVYRGHVSEFVDHEVRDEALLQEAKHRGLEAPAGKAATGDRESAKRALLGALTREVSAEVQRTVNAQHVTEEELRNAYRTEAQSPGRRFTYWPERVKVIAMVFRDEGDAARAAKEAKGPSGKTSEGFRRVYHEHERSIIARNRTKGVKDREAAQTWDAFLMKGAEGERWPAEVFELAFAAKPDDIVGPISRMDGRHEEKRHYVIKVLAHHGETGTLEQVRDEMSHLALGFKRKQAVHRAVRRIVEARARIDNQAVSSLTLDPPVERR